jgi:hypothetical protein
MVDRRCPGCSQPPSACWVVNEPADTPAGDVAQDRDWYRLLRGDLGDRQERATHAPCPVDLPPAGSLTVERTPVPAMRSRPMIAWLQSNSATNHHVYKATAHLDVGDLVVDRR